MTGRTARRTTNWPGLVALLAFVLVPAVAQAAEASLAAIDGMAEGLLISPDGQVVIGRNGADALVWRKGAITSLPAMAGQSELTVTSLSGDGSVIVGYAGEFGVSSVAFALRGGTYTALPTIMGSISEAYDISTDGRVIVGVSSARTTWNAVRWVDGVVDDLGTLPGGLFATAYAVNRDGSVVAGTGEMAGSGPLEGFRWDAATRRMVPLGHLPNGTGDVWVNDMNADGSVIVGFEYSGSLSRAFRWTLLGGMGDLGLLPGDSSAEARSVSGDGSIVVGWSGTEESAASRAFFWTEAGGMQPLARLLEDMGADLGDIVLQGAVAISSDGQLILVNGQASGAPGSWIIRYLAAAPDPDPVPEPPIAGLTTSDSVAGSFDGLPAARACLMARQHGVAASLIGDTRPIDRGSEAGLFGLADTGAGAPQMGASGRFVFGPGVTLLGGLAYQEQACQSASTDGSLLAALALRYVGPGTLLRPLVEVGGFLSPDTAATFERHYANGSRQAEGSATASGWGGYGFARAGLVLTPGWGMEAALSAEIGTQRLTTDATAEALSRSNPFEAHFASLTTTMRVAKIRAQLSQTLGERLEATLWAAGALGFAAEGTLVAAVPGIGRLETEPLDRLVWAEYGARLGYQLSDRLTVEASASGLTVGESLGTTIALGAGAQLRF